MRETSNQGAHFWAKRCTAEEAGGARQRGTVMKRLLLVLIVVLIGFGFYRAWFSFTLDKDKIKEDRDKAVEKLRELENKVREETSRPPQHTPKQEPER
jgi:hypothetical protein